MLVKSAVELHRIEGEFGESARAAGCLDSFFA
jgi:hypothetical protein